MANQEKIDEIVSEQAFGQLPRLQGQLEDTVESFVKAIIAAEKFNSTVGGSTTFKDFEANQKKQQDNLSKTTVAQERLAKAKIQTQIAEQKLIAEEEKNAARRQAISQKEIDRENARIAREVKKGKAIVSNSQLEIDAYNNTVNGSKKVNSTINDQNKAYADASSKAAAFVSVQKKVAVETLKVKPAAIAAQESIDRLKLKIQNYQNIVNGSKDINRNSLFNAKIQETEAQIARLSNVGKKGFDDMGNAIAKNKSSLNGVWSGLKTVANILPGVGIAGLLAFAVEPLMNYISSLDLFKSKLSQVQLTQEALNEALKGTEYLDAVKEVSELTINLDLAKKGMYDKKAVVDQYNNSIGETAGQVKTLDEVEKALVKNADAYIQMTLYKAAANIQLEKAAQKASEIQENSLKKSQEFANTFDQIIGSIGAGGGGAASQFGVSTFNQKEYERSLAADGEKRKKVRQKELKKEQDDLKTNAKSLLQLAADQAKLMGGVLGTDLSKKPSAKKVETSEFDAQRERVERTKNASKEIIDDERESFDIRLQALDVFINQSEELVRINYDRNVKKAKGNSEQLKFLAEQQQTDLEKVRIEGRERGFKLFQDQLNEEQKERIRVNQEELNSINNEEALKLDVLNQAFANRTISETQFGELRQDIQREFIKKYIEAEIKQVEDLLAISSLSVDQRAEYEKKLAELKLKLSRETTKNQIEDNKSITRSEEENARKRAEIDKQLADKKKELQKEVFDLAVAVVNGTFDNQKNKVQQEIDLVEQRKEADIENVNNSVLSEQEKADKIKTIEAAALANKEVLEQRQRQIDQRKARFQKALSVAEVVVNTFKDVAKISTGAAALSIIPIVGPALAAAALAQIPWAIGIGAAQVGAILATPIPAFEHGGTMKKSGPALYGEVGPELMIDPSGKLTLTPGTPTVGHVEAGTKFISNRDLVRMLAKPELTQNITGQSFDVSALVMEHRNSTKRLEKALLRQKPANGPVVNIYGMGDYMNRNFS